MLKPSLKFLVYFAVFSLTGPLWGREFLWYRIIQGLTHRCLLHVRWELRSHLKMEPIGCTETSVRNYFYSLRNDREESSSHLLHGTSLKTRVFSLLLGMKQVSLCVVLFVSSFGRVVNRLLGISLKSGAFRTLSDISNCHTSSYNMTIPNTEVLLSP